MTHVIRRFQPKTRPNSYDPETRTGEAVIASDQVVAGVRIPLSLFLASGLPKTLPLQVDHNNAVSEKRGEWFDLRIERGDHGGEVLVGKFRLSGRADNDAFHTLFSEGMPPGVSIAAHVTKWGSEIDPQTGKKVRIAERGSLTEASLVNNPADATAMVRSMTMDPETLEQDQQQTNDDVCLTDEQWDTLCRSAGVSDEVRDVIKRSNVPDADKMRMAYATVQSAKTPARVAAPHNEQTLDNPTVLRNAVIEHYDAINRGEEPANQARDVFAQGERALAERLCRMNNIDTLGMSDADVKRSAQTTSDFAIIAGGTFNLAMRREFENAASPISSLFGRDTVGTFNPETRAQADWTTLAISDKLEDGHYEHSFIDENGETVRVAVLGGITSKSYELGINAGSRLGNDGTQFGKRLAAEVADRQVAFLEQGEGDGPPMKDQQTVFHADRGNIEIFTVDGSSEISQLMKIRARMAKRKGAGDVMIGMYPTHWLVHSDFEETALRLLSSVQASAVGDVNPMAGRLQVVVEPRLANPDASHLVVDPARMDGAVRVFLRGHEAPFTDSRINFETDATQFKIRHPFGLSWLEWRSWTRLDFGAGG